MAALLLGACATDDSPTIGAPPGDTTTTPGDEVGEGAGTTTTPDGTVPNGPDATVAEPPAPPGDDTLDPGSGPGQDDPRFPDLDANVPVGRFAPALLRPDQSNRIVVEVQAEASAAPSSTTLDRLRAVLAAITGKEVVVTAGGTPPSRQEWSGDTIRAAADDGARTAQGGGTAVLRLLFVGGTFEGNEDVLGVAVRGDTAAVFIERVAAVERGLLGDSGDRIELAVTMHEVGHLLGLVDLHLATGRADPEHPGHSRNQASVMYYAIEDASVLGLLFGPEPPTDFDDADRADLAAIAAGG